MTLTETSNNSNTTKTTVQQVQKKSKLWIKIFLSLIVIILWIVLALFVVKVIKKQQVYTYSVLSYCQTHKHASIEDYNRLDSYKDKRVWFKFCEEAFLKARKEWVDSHPELYED